MHSKLQLAAADLTDWFWSCNFFKNLPGMQSNAASAATGP
jgi:hypothetical protein